MQYSDEQIFRELGHISRNLRGMRVGLCCAFADARDMGLSPRHMVRAVKLGMAAAQAFAGLEINVVKLRADGIDGNLTSAWNQAQRSIFAPGMAPPGDMRGVWQPFAAVMQATHDRYSAAAADAHARAEKVKFGIYREHGYWLGQWGKLRNALRVVESIQTSMDHIAAEVDVLGPAGRISFLRSFTPDMRRAGIVPP